MVLKKKKKIIIPASFYVMRGCGVAGLAKTLDIFSLLHWLLAIFAARWSGVGMTVCEAWGVWPTSVELNAVLVISPVCTPQIRPQRFQRTPWILITSTGIS